MATPFPAAAMLAEKYGLSVRQATKSGCPPVIGIERVNKNHAGLRLSDCEDYNEAMLQELQHGPRPLLAILASRWSLYMETKGGPGDGSTFAIDGDDKSLDIATSRHVFERGLGRTLDALAALSIPVLLIGQAPEFPLSPNFCIVHNALYRRDVGDCLTLPREAADRRLDASTKILKKFASSKPGVMYVGLNTILCDTETCWAAKQGTPLYRDYSHLCLSGAKFIGTALLADPDLKPLFASRGSGAAQANMQFGKRGDK